MFYREICERLRCGYNDKCYMPKPELVIENEKRMIILEIQMNY